MTFTNLINSVLRRLREDEISSPTTNGYSKLIGDLINETKREVEDAWNWAALRQHITIVTTQSVYQYPLVGSGNRSKILDAYNITNGVGLHRRHRKEFHRQIFNVTEAPPSSYITEGQDANGDMVVKLSPIPDGVYTLTFSLVTPQDHFSTGEETLSVPSWPIVLGGYAKALAERGEDNGRSHGEAEGRYMNALSDAIALDNSNAYGEDMWHYA